MTGNLFRSQSRKALSLSADLDGVPQIPMHFKEVSAVAATVSPSIQNTATLTTPETAPST